MTELRLSRRNALKASVFGGGALALGAGSAQSQAVLTPFIDPLPIPPILQPVATFAPKADVSATNVDGTHTFHVSGPRMVAANTKYYKIEEKQAYHKFHSQLPATSIWGYEGTLPGPTYITESGTPTLIRYANNLPTNDPVGIGEPVSVIHRHGGFQAPEDDGYPMDCFASGQTRDYYYPCAPEGGLAQNEVSCLWYHDHSVDATATNVYRGLMGFNMNFDTLDSKLGEADPNPAALRLPGKMSADGKQRLFDVPLAIADRTFDANGQLVYNSFLHDGFIGDPRLSVNGKVQPYLVVKRRKYRFRIYNCCNARMLQLYLVVNGTAVPFHCVIGSDLSLFEKPLYNVGNLRMGPAERFDVVLDFSKFAAGSQVYIENRMLQINGRKPEGVEATGPKILKFSVGSETPIDVSRVPSTLRACPEGLNYLLPKVQVERTFEFGRSNGAWTINDKFFDENRIMAKPKLGVPEIWTLTSGGGWSHPIHIHLTEFYILSRNGVAPPLLERGRKDTVRVGWKDGDVKILVNFTGHTGRYVFHCHNMEHEDMRMMANMELQA
jgi:FtsP/CotA-like multicopper oxidase with cupredoxin domain